MGQTITTGQAQAPLTTAQPYTALRETHTGVVVLIGDLAYKGKKPITTDFLDFSTPERRERACQRELELNRRLAPASYLGLAHLSMPSSGTAGSRCSSCGDTRTRAGWPRSCVAANRSPTH